MELHPKVDREWFEEEKARYDERVAERNRGLAMTQEEWDADIERQRQEIIEQHKDLPGWEWRRDLFLSSLEMTKTHPSKIYDMGINAPHMKRIGSFAEDRYWMNWKPDFPKNQWTLKIDIWGSTFLLPFDSGSDAIEYALWSMKNNMGDPAKVYKGNDVYVKSFVNGIVLKEIDKE